MYTTYHLNSAQELSSDILDGIKALYKSKPITIIVEEDTSDLDLTDEMKFILDKRLLEDRKNYFSAEDSVDQLHKKYGV